MPIVRSQSANLQGQSLTVTQVVTVHDWLPFLPAWRELLEDSESSAVTLTPEWLLTWWDIFGSQQGRQLRVVLFHEGDRLVGLAPLLARRYWYRPGLPFRRLEFLASGEHDQDAICSDYLNIVVRRGWEATIARQLIESVVRGELGRWDELVLPMMDGTLAMPQLLITEGQRAGLNTTITETTRAPYIALPPTWDDYLKQLGKKERYLIQRSLRDFEEWARGEWRLEVATSSTLAEGKRILKTLHHSRWEGSGAGVFRSPYFLAFHDRIMDQLVERNALELMWLTVRDEPIAVMYNVTHRGTTSFYQCGRKLDVPKAIRPGGILLYLAIRHAIERGQQQFDFLGGEALYKRQLANSSRPLVEVRLARQSLVEFLRALKEQFRGQLRPLWHRLKRVRQERNRGEVSNDS